MANNVVPDQTLENAAPDQGSPCLHLGQELLLNVVTIKPNQTLIKTGTVAQLVERPLCGWEDAVSIPGRIIPNTLKMVVAALSLGAQH